MTSLPNRLREETRIAHMQLESLLHPLLRAPQPAAYGRLLLALYGYLVPLEQAMTAAASRGATRGFLSVRRHSLRLAADLDALGVPRQQVVQCTALPVLDGAPAALGSAYVIEGSMLGGRVISRWLDEALGLHPGNGAAYFAGYGPDTAQMWRATLAQLDRQVPVECHGRAVQAAQETFSTLHDWLAPTVARTRR